MFRYLWKVKKIEQPEQEHNLDPYKEDLVLTDEVYEKNNQEDQTLILDVEVDKKFKKKQVSKIYKTSEILSPAVRKLVADKKIDISNLEGTGKDGRIVKGDIISLMGTTPQPSERKNNYGPEERIKMTRLRVTIAKRLKEAQDKLFIMHQGMRKNFII